VIYAVNVMTNVQRTFGATGYYVIVAMITTQTKNSKRGDLVTMKNKSNVLSRFVVGFIDLMYFAIGVLVVMMLSYLVALEWNERQLNENKKVCIEGREIANACNVGLGEWKRSKHDCV